MTENIFKINNECEQILNLIEGYLGLPKKPGPKEHYLRKFLYYMKREIKNLQEALNEELKEEY